MNGKYYFFRNSNSTFNFIDYFTRINLIFHFTRVTLIFPFKFSVVVLTRVENLSSHNFQYF